MEIMLSMFVHMHYLCVCLLVCLSILAMGLLKLWDQQTPLNPASEKLYLIKFWMPLACVFSLASVCSEATDFV